MTTKTRIVDELGEKALMLPDLVNASLTANDRAKYLMTLLQTAREHADHPGQSISDLKQERLACDLADDQFDSVVARSSKSGANIYHIPLASVLHCQLIENIRGMMDPLGFRPQVVEVRERPSDTYRKRLDDLLAHAPPLQDDRLPGDYIDRVTSALRDRQDSLHLLVMDLHKELNRLQQQIASETIDGACVYSIQAEDRPLIAAFMSGLNRTRELRFDHPGLGTTATRSGDRLVLQNDIGLTEAHVLVIHIEPPQVSLTCTDIYPQRLLFFQDLFQRFAMQWSDTLSRQAPRMEEQRYYLSRATYVARDRADLEDFLRFLGSRVVFLIDWNRARKRLRRFAPKRVCLEVLRWAADNDHGHRAFLQLGGEQLIIHSLESSMRTPLPWGVQFSDLVGPQRAAEFLKFTLKTASEGLLARRSESLIRDEIAAEFRHYVETVHQEFLEIAADHASLIDELAMAVRDALLLTQPSGDAASMQRIVQRARKWEHNADELVTKARTARTRLDNHKTVPELLAVADDVADQLEDAIFLRSLLATSGVTADSLVCLQDLAALLVQGAQEYLKAVANARVLQRGSPREEVQDFLEAIDRVVGVEHQTDDAHRQARASILTFRGDFRQWQLIIDLADHLEEAADALMRSALILRNYILGEVLTR
jgi:uncharacterized protein Yka (UPF0111/DUF47 family)